MAGRQSLVLGTALDMGGGKTEVGFRLQNIFPSPGQVPGAM